MKRRGFLTSAAAMAAVPTAGLAVTASPSAYFPEGWQKLVGNLRAGEFLRTDEYCVVNAPDLDAIYSTVDGEALDPTSANDPLPEWIAKWKSVRAEWGTNGFDSDGEETPYGLRIYGEVETLSARIANARATTAAGVRAQLEWLEEDTDSLQCLCDDSVYALRNAIAALKAGVV